jgi:hypothetical protein
VNKTVSIAFERAECVLPVSKIIPQRAVSPEDRQTLKYKMIAQSIKTVGLIEALIVYPKEAGEYLLLDGHFRLEAVKDLGGRDVRCILSTDDEAYTYNKRVNAVSHIAQHFMIQKALENGVPEGRLSAALGIQLKTVRMRRDLLNGICPEVVHLLRNKKVPFGVFGLLRKMKPVRQIEASEHMAAAGAYSVRFANALLAVTKPELLTTPTRKPKGKVTSTADQEVLGIETEHLVRDLKKVEESYGQDVLAFTVCSAFLKKLLDNPRVEGYLSLNHSARLDAMRGAITE